MDEPKYTYEEFIKRFKGARTPCERCSGLGSKMYSSTATWHGGIGGAAMSRDICDRCWGSGDADYPFADQRKIKQNTEAAVKARAATLFADTLGTSFSSMKPALEELITELKKMAKGRKQRPWFYYETCDHLAKLFTKLIESNK